ncbi:MAG: sialidase family protein, partial [Candidatus Acidiferrales bacterium]
AVGSFRDSAFGNRILSNRRQPPPTNLQLIARHPHLYSFYNSLGETELAEAEMAEIKKTGTLVGMISYKDGDRQIKGPFSSMAMAKEKNRGAFPGPSVVLKDGSILTFYFAKHKGYVSNRYTLEAVRTNADRSSLGSPVRIEEFVDAAGNESYTQDCDYFLNGAGAYDPIHNKLYYVFPELRDKGCHLFLTTSTDGGRSWAKAQPILSSGDTAASGYTNPAIAVNLDGVLAVMWEQNRQSGCWMFAVSEDSGVSLSRAQRLGTCGAGENARNALSTAYLWTVIYQADSVHKGRFEAGSARIILRNTWNAGGPHDRGIGITPDGAFHPIWIDAGTGEGELRTVAIHVTSASALIASGTKGLTEITNDVAILYGGDQQYDAESEILTVNIVIKNKGAESIHGPVKLAVPNLSRDYGYADIANAENEANGSGAIWDISSSISGDTLDPGATSRPFSLKFRYLADQEEKRPLAGEDFLDLNIRVFAHIQGNMVPQQ